MKSEIMKVRITQITARQTIDLRHRVMWPDLPREEVMLPEDETALHFGAFDQQALVGVGSFFHDGESCRLRKLAVEPAYQGQGIASLLLTHAFEHLSALDCRIVWCDARVTALEFYRRNGFESDGEIFQKRGIDYVVARRYLAAKAD